jgi:ATP-binding cassette subfamily C protein
MARNGSFRWRGWPSNTSKRNPDGRGSAADEAVEALGMRALCERLGGYGARTEPGALSAGERHLVSRARTPHRRRS